MISFRIIALSEARNKSERFQQIKKFVLYFDTNYTGWLTQFWLSLDVNICQATWGLLTLEILRKPLIFSSLASGYNNFELLCRSNCVPSYRKWAKRFIHASKALNRVKEA